MSYMKSLADGIRNNLSEDTDGYENIIINDDLFLIYAVLAKVLGSYVSAEDVHDAWTAWMEMHGRGDHKSAVPFDYLDDKTKAEDNPFVEAIRATIW